LKNVEGDPNHPILIGNPKIGQIIIIFESTTPPLEVYDSMKQSPMEVVNIEYDLGPVEADPEYLLIVEANNLAAEIDSETNTIHKFAR
jgi:hypothetical protein